MRLGDFDALKDSLILKFGNLLPNGLLEEIDNAPTIEAKIIIDRKTYQHNYYERVTKAKRQANKKSGGKK